MKGNIDYLERDNETGEDSVSSMKGIIRCPECGRAVDKEADVCPDCGAFVDYCMVEEELEDDSVYETEYEDMGIDTSDSNDSVFEPDDTEPVDGEGEHVEVSEQDETVCRLLDLIRQKLEKVHRHHKHSSRHSGSFDTSISAMFSKWVDSNKQKMARLYYLLKLKNKRMRISPLRDMLAETEYDESFIRSCLATLKIKGTEQDNFIMWFHTRAW